MKITTKTEFYIAKHPEVMKKWLKKKLNRELTYQEKIDYIRVINRDPYEEQYIWTNEFEKTKRVLGEISLL